MAAECGAALIQTGRPQEWLDLLAELPEPVRNAGRIRLLEAQAAAQRAWRAVFETVDFVLFPPCVKTKFFTR